jgi:hypothetical protein
MLKTRQYNMPPILQYTFNDDIQSMGSIECKSQIFWFFNVQELGQVFSSSLSTQLPAGVI